MRYDAIIAGRYHRAIGLGHLTGATLQCLAGRVHCAYFDPKPEFSDYSGFPPQIEVVRTVDKDKASADVLLFTDVLWNGIGDRSVLELPEAKIRFAYTMFDSSRLLPEWVRLCNESFDGVIVPDAEVAAAYRNSGVWRPVFVLPFPLDLENIGVERRSHEHGEPFVFGCVAAYHPRKNLRLLIEAFLSAFGPHDTTTQLHIHSNLAFIGEFEQIEELVRSRGASNIQLSRRSLNRAEYIEFLKGTDVMVQISRGEGFSIPIREALAMGKRCIVSDTMAHRAICATGLVRAVEAPSVQPAVYDEINGLVGGCQFSPLLADVAQALHEVRNAGEDGREFERHDWARQFTVERLRDRFCAIFRPGEAILSETDEIKANAVLTRDAHLVAKYHKLMRSEPYLVRAAEGRKRVLIGHDGGYFSLFNTLLSHIVWSVGRDGVRWVLPDWRVKKMKEYWERDSFTSFCYGREEDGNIWLKLYEPLYDDLDPEVYQRDELLYSDGPAFHDFNEKNEPLLTYIHAYKLYRQPDFPHWRRWYNYYYKKYIRVRPHIRQRVEEIFYSAMEGKYCIGVHARHPSHAIEQPDGKMPYLDRFLQLADAVAAACKGYRYPDWRVFLATDQESVVNYFRSRLGDRLVAISDVARTTLEQDAEFEKLSAEEKFREGFQIQHRTAADSSRWSVRMAEDVILDAMLLARCHALIHTTSNIATAVAFMNPDLQMVYCE